MDSFLQRYHHHPALGHIRASLRRDWYLRLFCASLLLGGGINLCFFFFAVSSLFSIIGLVAVLGAIYMFSVLIQQGVLTQHPILTQLEYAPQEIVWIYTLHTQRMPFGLKVFDSGLLYLKLINGSHHCLSLPTRQLKLVSRFLNRYLPHASVGYNEERAQWYRAAPALLLQEPPEKDEDD